MVSSNFQLKLFLKCTKSNFVRLFLNTILNFYTFTKSLHDANWQTSRLFKCCHFFVSDIKKFFCSSYHALSEWELMLVDRELHFQTFQLFDHVESWDRQRFRKKKNFWCYLHFRIWCIQSVILHHFQFSALHTLKKPVKFHLHLDAYPSFLP